MDREVESGLGELLTFFGVEQCGILAIQQDRRKAHLRHHAYVEGVEPLPTTIDFGSFFPWTHERSVMQGRMFFQTSREELPPEAAVDCASSAALGLDAIVNMPVGIGGRITHVLGLVSSRPIKKWSEPILAQLQIIAETFLSALARKEVEQALASSERSLAQAQRIARVGSYDRNWLNATLIGSDEASRIIGRDISAATGDITDFIHPQDQTHFTDAMERMIRTRTPWIDVEYRVVRADDSVRTVRSRVEITYGPDGAPLRTIGTIQDISELRAAEQESRELHARLRHADRAAHIGALTASLSHELSQPLTGILANTQAALRLIAENRIDTAHLQTILEAIVRDDKRAGTVIANLRALLRREEPPRGRFDVAEAVSEVMILYKSELEASHVRIDASLETGCMALAVRTQIQQVMLNLLSNALRALQDVPVANRHLWLTLKRTEQRLVEIAVEDSGLGMPPERLQHVFDPFFTTHRDGLGMGLAIARSIAESNDGALTAEVRDGGGACFRFMLPVEAPRRALGFESESQLPIQEKTPPADMGKHTICVIDDDSATREGVARLLETAGWRAVTFDSAASALASPELLAAHCVVLDVQMPQMRGPALQIELARRNPTIPVIFLAASESAATVVEVVKQGAVEYLCKPVDGTVLIEAVSKALVRQAAGNRTLRARESIEQKLATLTNRERDVLRQVLTGQLNKQIAATLSISEATVKQHRAQVMEKLGVRSVPELVRVCQIVELPSQP